MSIHKLRKSSTQFWRSHSQTMFICLVQVNTRNCDTVVAGIQFGVMGCLSTVSTFAAEFNKMRLSSDPWTAYAYAAITICVSFSFGILIYCIPYWTKGFDIDM
jgi:fluoride ion exporter CrcB/FEX